MSFQDLEYAICQYLDGTLSADRVDELEARLQGDEAARRVLEEYRQLDAVLKHSNAVPELQWDRLAEHLSNCVEVEVEATEYAAVQFVDGALSADESAAFAARAREDRRVGELVESHALLRGALRALPTPDVRWDELADRLYDAATGANRSFKLPSFRTLRIAGSIAVAACVLIVTAVGLRSHHLPASGKVDQIAAAVAPSKMEIQIGGMGPVAEAGKPAVQISIGGGTDQPGTGGTELAEGIVVSGSPRSLIATNAPVASDAQMPY